MIGCFRIYHPKWTVEEALSGEGAKRTGGRWNSKGHRVVYTSETLSLAAFEVLVHLNNSDILNRYLLVEISVPETCVVDFPMGELPVGWDANVLNPVTQDYGDYWLQQGDSLALRVPSVINARESNILINPEHPDWNKITVGDPEPFRFDKRLHKKE